MGQVGFSENAPSAKRVLPLLCSFEQDGVSSFKVEWRVVSVDSHASNGNYGFGIGN
jgi:methionine-rich copper-binding protein CopC